MLAGRDETPRNNNSTKDKFVSQTNDNTLHRLWSKVVVAESGCWEFQAGYKWESGYACFWHNGRNERAHRVSLMLFEGSPPAGKPMALHTCANKLCVNPAHLYWGDAKDNYEDLKEQYPDSPSFKSGFHVGHDRNWNQARTLEDSHIEYIKALLNAGFTCREISRWYGVSKVAIAGIKSGKTYRYIQPYPIRHVEGVKKVYPSRQGGSKLTVRQVAEIKARLASGEIPKDIAPKYNVNRSCIEKIQAGVRWKDVEPMDVALVQS